MTTGAMVECASCTEAMVVKARDCASIDAAVVNKTRQTGRIAGSLTG